MLNGGAGNDGISGSTGNDVIDGGGGNDGIDGGTGNDTLNGGAGNDVIVGAEGNDVLGGGDGNDDLSGSDGNDDLDGDVGNDDLEGGTGNDVLKGDVGNDELQGFAGDDVLRGGNGTDTLFGGAANALDQDRFDFDLTANTAVGAGRDVISDWNDSAAAGEDVIDVDGIDADTGTANDQDFSAVFIAQGNPFTAAAQIRLIVDPANVNNRIVQLNTDLDAAPEAEILVVGAGTTLTSADFDL